MSRLRVTSILAFAFVSIVNGFAQQPPKELVDYVRDARKAGLKDSQIQQNAMSAGWPAAAVTGALESGRKAAGEGTPTSSAPATVKSEEAKKPVTSPPQLPQQPEQSRPAPAPATSTPPETQTPPSAAPTNAPAEPPKIAAVDRGVPDDYVIGEGDVLHISVWKEPDASVPSVVVRPDGKITLPMIKDLQVSGLTPAQAERLITEQLAKFISAADVTVIVSGINSKKIYVVGGVGKEGPIPYTYRMTVLQAISEAGGLTDYAKKKKIYVLRRENGRDYRLPFDYDAVLKGERMELNIPLMPGDTLVVPK